MDTTEKITTHMALAEAHRVTDELMTFVAELAATDELSRESALEVLGHLHTVQGEIQVAIDAVDVEGRLYLSGGDDG